VPHEKPRLLRDRLAWQVTLFMGVQSLMFYSLLSWVPSILQDHGMSKGTSGAYLSVYTLLGIPVCLVVPMIAARLRNQSWLVAVSVTCLSGGLVGLIASPASAAIVWVMFLGIAQAATLSLAFLFFVLRSRSQAEAAELSSMAQSFGYALAALGPVIMGGLHEATGSWTLPLVFLLVLSLPELVFGLLAGRDRHVGGG
jgi:MFS transporter, CP family, cyanate transporter